MDGLRMRLVSGIIMGWGTEAGRIGGVLVELFGVEVLVGISELAIVGHLELVLVEGSGCKWRMRESALTIPFLGVSSGMPWQGRHLSF